MLDSAAMHLVLSNAAMHLNFLRGDPVEDVTVLAHDAAAIQSVNGRMGQTSQNTTDKMLGAILGVCSSIF